VGGLTEREMGERQAGVRIVARALSEPFHCILRNSGLNAEAGEAMRGDRAGRGFDALERRFGAMLDMGIADPVKVLSALRRCALLFRRDRACDLQLMASEH
jgi:chaperonin GroEL